MSSPSGPILTNAFLCHYQKIWLNDCLSQFKPVVYRRYVDNIFVLFKSKKHLKLVNYMNSKHINIRFTFQTEDSNNFSFQVAKLPAKTNGLLLRFFAKPLVVKFLLIVIVLFLIPTRQVQFTHFCSASSKFVPVWKILLQKQNS